MSAIASQINVVSMVCTTMCSDADQRKYQSSASLALVRGNHRGFPSQRDSNAKMFSFDDAIMNCQNAAWSRLPCWMTLFDHRNRTKNINSRGNFGGNLSICVVRVQIAYCLLLLGDKSSVGTMIAKFIFSMHWKTRVVIMPTSPSKTAPLFVIIMTTCGTAGDDKFGILCQHLVFSIYENGT